MNEICYPTNGIFRGAQFDTHGQPLIIKGYTEINGFLWWYGDITGDKVFIIGCNNFADTLTANESFDSRSSNINKVKTYDLQGEAHNTTIKILQVIANKQTRKEIPQFYMYESSRINKIEFIGFEKPGIVHLHGNSTVGTIINGDIEEKKV